MKTKPFSVIFEGTHLELDSLDEWIKTNLIGSNFDFLYYSKTDYDYGFAEYFGASEANIIELTKIIPNIYTIFPDSLEPNVACKTFGSGNWIEYSPQAVDGIIMRLKKNKKKP